MKRIYSSESPRRVRLREGRREGDFRGLRSGMETRGESLAGWFELLGDLEFAGFSSAALRTSSSAAPLTRWAASFRIRKCAVWRGCRA